MIMGKIVIFGISRNVTEKAPMRA